MVLVRSVGWTTSSMCGEHAATNMWKRCFGCVGWRRHMVEGCVVQVRLISVDGKWRLVMEDGMSAGGSGT